MATKTSPTLWSRYVSTVRVVDKGVNYALGEWGALVAHRPVLTLDDLDYELWRWWLRLYLWLCLSLRFWLLYHHCYI